MVLNRTEREEIRLKSLYAREVSLFKNFGIIAGVDEVGRGSLAGPVYACALILKYDNKIINLKDSKKLSPLMRSQVKEKILDNYIDYAYGNATVEEIEELNILEASLLAMRRALSNLKVKPMYVLVDGNRSINNLKIEQKTVVGGDNLFPSIAGASILAKLKRDSLMIEYDSIYQGYDFKSNKGYGTKKHYKAIDELGITPIHRKSFLKEYKNENTKIFK